MLILVRGAVPLISSVQSEDGSDVSVIFRMLWMHPGRSH